MALVDALQENFNIVCNQLQEVEATYGSAESCLKQRESDLQTREQECLNELQQLETEKMTKKTQKSIKENIQASFASNQELIGAQLKNQILGECLSFCDQQFQQAKKFQTASPQKTEVKSHLEATQRFETMEARLKERMELWQNKVVSDVIEPTLETQYNQMRKSFDKKLELKKQIAQSQTLTT